MAAAGKMAPITVHTTSANHQLRPRFQYDPAIVNYREQKPALIAVPVERRLHRAFLEALVAGCFDGTVSYEMCSPLRDGSVLEVLDRYARRFVEYMKRLQLETGTLPLACDGIRRFPAQ